MKKAFLIFFIILLAYGVAAVADQFSPDPRYDRAVTPILSSYSTTGHMAVAVTTSTAGIMYKSATRARSGVKVTVPVGTTIRGVSRGVAFFIYSGCTGTVERQKW